MEEKPKRRRSSKEELRARILLCVEMMGVRRWKKHQIKRAFKQEYGASWRQTERYIAAARKILLEESQAPADEHRSDALAFYARVLDSGDASWRDKIRAQNSIDKLLGLQKSTFHQEIVKSEQELKEDELDARRDRVLAALEQLKQRHEIRRFGVDDVSERSDN